MNRKKSIILLSAVVIIVFIIVVSYLLRPKKDEVNDLVDLTLVNSITIVNGITGEHIEFTNEELKKDVIDSLAKLQLTETSWRDSTGWVFALILKTEESEIKLTFLDEERCEDQDGNEYFMTNVDDNLKQLFNMN